MLAQTLYTAFQFLSKKPPNALTFQFNVTELTLPENVNFVEFIARADEGYEVYDVSATSGRLASHGIIRQAVSRPEV